MFPKIQAIFAIFYIISIQNVSSSTNTRDLDTAMLKELMERTDHIQELLDQMQTYMERMNSSNNVRFKRMQMPIDRMGRKMKQQGKRMNRQGNVFKKEGDLSQVMETIVEQQMVITAEIFTVSQTLPFCCCQYQNTPKPEQLVTTTAKPSKSINLCAEAMGESGSNGVYKINVPNSNIDPFEVYCMKKVSNLIEENIIQGTWLIVQRRQDNTTDFYQNWDMYQRGFGDLKRNLWIGLDKLHALTSSSVQELWIELKDNDGKTAWAKYSNFAIGNGYEKYDLKTLGHYNGTAGDSLSYHLGSKWSTRDKDNDESDNNCAQMFSGAYWYKKCHDSNLNGVYGADNVAQGINWGTFGGDLYPLKYAHMAIRPEQLVTTIPKPSKSINHCAEAMGESGPDGVYKINVLNSNIDPFEVYCMKKVTNLLEEDIIKGTWLIFQRRQDNTTDFYQNWDMYQRGFGDLKRNLWLGLDKLRALTSSSEQELWIELKDNDGKTAWAKYSNFAIGNEYEKYDLKNLGHYNGTAGDSLTYHLGAKWSTRDKDNDESSNHCAQMYSGAYWYKKCHDSNLNGVYGANNVAQGINWGTFGGDLYPLKYAHMAIRPIQ